MGRRVAFGALWLVIGLLPLSLLTYTGVTQADRAVRQEVWNRVRNTASASRVVVEQQFTTLRQLVDAYAQRAEVRREVAAGKPDTARYRRDLVRFRAGIDGVIVTTSEGRLAGAAPDGAALAQDPSLTDWYRAVRGRGQVYVSQAYTPPPGETRAARAVAVAAPVSGPDGQVGVLAVVFRLDAIQELATQTAEAQGVRLLITDQAGVLVADPGQRLYALTSLREDPRVDAALAGRRPTSEQRSFGVMTLSASEPVPSVGWTVTAEVPAVQALASASRLRVRILSIAALLAAVILAGLGVLLHAQRGRQRARQALARARDEALGASAAKSDFLAKVSHELRTPVNGVMGMNELLLRTGLDGEQRHYASTVRGSARNLLGLLDDFLDLTRIEAGQLRVEEAPFDPAELCRDVVAPLVPAAYSRGLWLDLHLANDLPPLITGDAERLRQVLANLVGNALKFTGQGGIDLSVSVAGDRLRFTVTDTGAGIAPADQERIFEAFQQAGSGTGGSGLGLAISRSLVELMGGRIELDSVVGVGSRFSVLLPLRPAEPGPVPPPPEPVRHEPARILVVEDDHVSRQVAALLLSKAGHEVDTAQDGEQAVAAALTGGYELILMDCQLPVLDGLAATRRIRAALGAELPIIAVTASAMPEDRERCAEAGMTGFLTKPVDWNLVLGMLPSWISGERALDADVVRELLTLPDADLTAIAEAFAAETPRLWGELSRAVQDGDLDRTAALAHRLQGGCATVGAVTAAALCETIVELADAQRASDLPAAVAELSVALDEAAGEMETWPSSTAP